MSKVVIITTGGTIAMQHDSLTGAAVPAVSGADLVRAIPGLGSVCDLEVREFDNLPSPAITPDHMFRLAVMVRQYLARDDVSGVVITHGTDSLEESAYFLDLSLEGHKPVCFTAAMRSGDELSPDGPRNILAAVRVAAARPARHMGSLVVMNEQIHAAREVTKTHAANVATFQSPWWGPLGVVDGDRVIFRRAQLGRQTFLPHSLCKKVDLIKLVTGSDAAYLDFAVSRGVDGIVVESFGRGNVPPPCDTRHRARPGKRGHRGQRHPHGRPRAGRIRLRGRHAATAQDGGHHGRGTERRQGPPQTAAHPQPVRPRRPSRSRGSGPVLRAQHVSPAPLDGVSRYCARRTR